MSPIHPLIASVLTSANIDPSSSSLSGNVLTTPSGSRYYAKTSPTAQITAELDSLRAMSHSAPEGFIPRIFGSKEDGPASAMVSEYFDLGGSTTQKELASSLAQMHRYGPRGAAGRFGFDVPTFCGATEQDNTWEVSWEVFFRDRRLGDLVRRLKDQEISTEWERLREGSVAELGASSRRQPLRSPHHETEREHSAESQRSPAAPARSPPPAGHTPRRPVVWQRRPQPIHRQSGRI